jgi:hypothetical protein
MMRLSRKLELQIGKPPNQSLKPTPYSAHRAGGAPAKDGGFMQPIIPVVPLSPEDHLKYIAADQRSAVGVSVTRLYNVLESC